MRKLLFFIPFIVLFLVGSCQIQNKEPKAKYVFLFIGDGMGMNQVYSTELYLNALNPNVGKKGLSFSNFPVQSFVSTFSANSLITCSSASGTALASGFKTNNGYLNVDTSQTIKFETIAEKAEKAGYKVGILSSVSIDHATPASFYGHQNSRDMYYEISMELPESGFDYFGGGGFNYPQGKQKNMPNAIDNAIAKGYNYVNTREAFDNLKNGDSKVFAVNPQTYPKGEFYWSIDSVQGSISLAEFTKKGIEVLDNPKGFFMMVEGGKIDWACHGNDMATIIHEIIVFSDAVEEAIAFYKMHPDETLILVTADHETGGLALGINKPLNFGILQHQNASSQEFSRKLIKYKLENPNASFDDILQLIEQYFGLGNRYKGLELNEKEKKYLFEGYKLEFVNRISPNPDDEYLEESKVLLITERVIHLMNQKAGISWASNNHSGAPVPIRAIGQGQKYFGSYVDNTDIPKIIAKLMDL